MGISKQDVTVNVSVNAKEANIGLGQVVDSLGKVEDAANKTAASTDAVQDALNKTAEVSKQTADVITKQEARKRREEEKTIADAQKRIAEFERIASTKIAARRASDQKIIDSARKALADVEGVDTKAARSTEAKNQRIINSALARLKTFENLTNQEARLLVEADKKVIASSEKTIRELNKNARARSRVGPAATAPETIGAKTGFLASAKAGMSSLMGVTTALGAAFYVAQAALAKLAEAFDKTVGAAIRLESQTAKIKTLLNANEKATLDFSAAILAQQRAYGTDTTETAKAYYEAIASGAVDGAGAIKLMDTAQKLAIGGVTSLDTAVNALTGAMNAYGFAATDAKNISDILFVAAAGGKTDIQALGRQLGDVMGIAKLAGISFKELAFATSAVTASGQTTNVAVTGVRAAISELLTPSKQLQLALKAVGIENVETALKSKGLVGVLRELKGAYGGNAQALAALFQSVESLPAISALAADGVGNSFDKMNEDMNRNLKDMKSATDEAFNTIAETSEAKIKKAHGQIGAALTELGGYFKTAYSYIIEQTGTFIETLSTKLGELMSNIRFLGNAIKQDFGGKIILPQVDVPAVKATPQLPSRGNAEAAIGAAASISAAGSFNKKAVEDYIKSFDELENKTKDLQKAQKEVGLEGEKLARAQLNTQLEAISKTREQAATLNLLSAPFEAVFTKARTAAENLYKTILNDDAKKFLKELIASNYNLSIETMKAAASESTAIDLTTQARLRELATIEKKQAALIRANPQIKAQLDATRALTVAEGERAKVALTGITEDQQSRVNSVLDDAHSLMEQNYLSQLRATELMDYQTQKRLKEIDALETQLRLQRELTTDELKRSEIDQAISNVQSSKRDIRVANEVTKTRTVNQSGGEIGQMAGVITEALGPLQAAMSAATGVVSALQGIVDFLPNFISSISNLLNSITDLPLKILEAVEGLLRAIPRLIAEFIPNILKMIFGLIEQIPMMFVDAIPKAVEDLVAAIPRVINGFIDKLPEIISKFVTGFITSTPRLLLALGKGLFALFVKLPVAFIQAIPEIVSGLVDGFINGIFGLGDMVADLFGNGLTKGVEQAQQAFVSLGTGVSDALFAVGDFAAESKAAKMAEDIGNAIQNATRRAVSWLQRIWDALSGVVQRAWAWVVINIFEPIGRVVQTAWKWVVDNIISPLAGVVSQAFGWVVEHVINPLASAVSTAFGWVVDKILTPLSTIVSGAFQGVVTFLTNVGSTIWNNFIAPVGNWFGDMGGRIWSGLLAGFSAAGTFFTSIGGYIWEGFKGILSSVGSLFLKSFSIDASGAIKGIENAFNAAFDFMKGIFKSLFNPLIDALNALKIPALKIKIPGIGKVTIWDDIDLLPGNIQRFAQGGMVEGKGTSDSVPAMLTPGEFVMSRKGVAALGQGTLERINQGTTRNENSNVSNISVNLTINASEKIDPNFVRDRIMPTIQDELLKRSRRGDYILAGSGVRS